MNIIAVSSRQNIFRGLSGEGHNCGAGAPERAAAMSNNFLRFSYSANLSFHISLWCCALYTSSPTIPSHFHSVHSHSGGPIHSQIRANEVSSAQFEALLCS